MSEFDDIFQVKRLKRNQRREWQISKKNAVDIEEIKDVDENTNILYSDKLIVMIIITFILLMFL